MADDGKRIRETIITVLDEYGIPYQDGFKHGRPAIYFTINGRDHGLSYRPGDPRAYLNARMQIKRALRHLGVIVADDTNPPTEQIDEPSKKVAEENPVEVQIPIVAEPDIVTEAPPSALSDDDEPVIHETTSTTEEVTPMHDGKSYVIFNTDKYTASQVQPVAQGGFIAIKLDRDLVAEKGRVLVIPIHQQNVVWDMPECEFQSCFQPKQSAEPIIEDAPVVEQPVAAIVTKEDPGQQDQPSYEPDQPVPVEDWGNSARSMVLRMPPPKPSVKAANEKPVAPQLGRVLVALNHAAGDKGRTIISTDLTPYLSTSDTKQVSGMLSQATGFEFVTKVMADGRYGYKITEKGQREANKLGAWPWEVRDLPVPAWLRKKMRG